MSARRRDEASRTSSPAAAPAAEDGQLGRLLEAEARHDQLLREARERAEEEIERARQECRRLRELEQEQRSHRLRSLEEELETALRERLDELDRRADEAESRWRTFDDAVVDELAARLTARLVDADTENGP